MNIKIISLIFILSCFINTLFCMPTPQSYGQLPPPPSAQEIEEIMKSPEFKNMMEELDKIFENIDEEDLQKPEEPKKRAAEKTSPTAKPKIPSKTKSIEQNFLEAVEPTTEKGDAGKLVKKLSTEKIEAFNYFINRFTKSLDNIEKKINSFEMGIAFKEYMENLGFGKSLNEINVAINQIRSKKLYKKIFFLPTNTELRKEIIDSLKASEKLEKNIEEKQSEESEKETIDFLQKRAATGSKIQTIKLDPLQKKLKALLNINLKNIDKKITTVSLNTQAKEEIEKKKKLREKQKKDAIEERKRAARSKPSPYRQPYRQPYSSGQDWPSYGRGKQKSYSGPGSWRNDYSRGYTPGRFNPTPTPSPTSLTTGPETTNKSSGGSHNLPEKIAGKLNLIKSINDENIQLLNEIKGKYDAKNEQKSFSQIYRSKLLQKIIRNFDRLEEARSTLSPEQKKQAKNETLNNAIINFMPLGIKLAANPTKLQEQQVQQDIIRRIVEMQPAIMKAESKKYAEEIIKKLAGKENLLISFDTSAQDIENIWRNLEILNSPPLENTKKIEEINEVFKKQYKIAQTNMENLQESSKQLGEITENIGVQLRRPPEAEAEPLLTGTELNKAIGQLPSQEIKELLTKKVTQIVPLGNADEELSEKQQKEIKETFTESITNIEAQQKFLSAIGEMFKRLEQEEN